MFDGLKFHRASESQRERDFHLLVSNEQNYFQMEF